MARRGIARSLNVNKAAGLHDFKACKQSYGLRLQPAAERRIDENDVERARLAGLQPFQGIGLNQVYAGLGPGLLNLTNAARRACTASGMFSTNVTSAAPRE